jgi:putative nucleotidyltransferase with HDIG domain
MANSAWYGVKDEVGSISQAVVLLGLERIREICLSSAVFDMFREGSEDGGLDLENFWKHSMAVGIIARKLCARYDKTKSQQSFLAGLLHDIGKLLFIRYYDCEYAELVSKAREESTLLFDEEIDLWGVSHAEVGQWLAKRWRFPKELQNAILYHHKPWECEGADIVLASVHFANILAQYSSLGDSGNGRLVMIEGEEEKFLKNWFPMDESFLTEVIQEMQTEVETELKRITGFI